LSVLKVLDPRLVAARAIVRDAAWAPIGGALLTAAIMLPSWQLHQEWRKVGPFLPTYIVPLRDLRGPEAAALALAGELCRERTPSRTDGLLTATFPVAQPCQPGDVAPIQTPACWTLPSEDRADGDAVAACHSFGDLGPVKRDGVCWGFARVGPPGTLARYSVDPASLSAADAALLDPVPWCVEPGNPIRASEWGVLLPIVESLKLWIISTAASSVLRSRAPRFWRILGAAGVASTYYLVLLPDALVLPAANDYSYRFAETTMLIVVPLVVLPALALWAAVEAARLGVAVALRRYGRRPG
jgi:hypothetical protein